MKTSALASKAIHTANPNATVSALGLAFASKWLTKEETVKIDGVNSKMSHWDRFIDQCEEVGDYPDAFAWHYYGSQDGDVSNNFDDKDNFIYQAQFLDNLIIGSQAEHP